MIPEITEKEKKTMNSCLFLVSVVLLLLCGYVSKWVCVWMMMMILHCVYGEKWGVRCVHT